MKKGIGIFTFLLSAHLSFSQTVSSSCSGSDGIYNAYLKSAQRLTMRKFMDENSTYLDSIHIPQSHVDTILNALIAVYNATGLAARDTVVTIYGITAQNYPTVDGIYIQPDTSLSWTDSLNNGVIPTGNFYIDSLIGAHYLTLDNYWETGFHDYGTASFDSDSSYNIFALGAAFMEAPMVYGSGLSAFTMDGNDISCIINSDHVELTYSHGWGDCISGCIDKRFWVFKVYFDCSVEYVGSYGDLIYYMDIDNGSEDKIQVYPNPGNSELNLVMTEIPQEYKIYSVSGQLKLSSKVENNKIDITDLRPGQYILKVTSENYEYSILILKE